MIKNGKNQQFNFKDNNNKNNRNKYNKSPNNLKRNSPILAHQENNYFYNTKINHLILQGISNTNKDQNIYEQPIPTSHHSIYVNYEFLDKNKNNDNNINSYYKKNNSCLQKMHTIVNFPKKYEKDLNNNSLNKEYKDKNGLNNFIISKTKDSLLKYSKSFVDENSNSNNKNIQNSSNSKNNYNPFQVLNYLKKRNFKSNNLIDVLNKEHTIGNQIENENNEINLSNNLSNNLSKSGIFKNSNNTIAEGKSQRNINNYFYNLQDNVDKNNLKLKSTNSSKKNIFINSFSSSNNIINNKNRKIPIKNGKIGNYQIKSPGILNSKRNLSKYGKNNNNNNSNRINIDKKKGCKSPELINNKLKDENSNSKNSNSLNKYYNASNNVYNAYNNKNIIYKKNEENDKKINIKVNNNQKRNLIKNNNNYKNRDNYNINNINRCNVNNIRNKNSNNLLSEKNSNYGLGNSLESLFDKKLSNEIYVKINPKNYKLIEFTNPNNSINNGYQSPKMGFSSEKKLKDINKFRQRIPSKIIDYNLMRKNIEEFCDILEQFYYNSFKGCFNYFIEKLKYFTERKNSNRAVILRRLKDGKRSHKTYTNNSMLNMNNNNLKLSINLKKDKEIDDLKKNSKSPTKFVELKNNLKSSMMNINQDNYIEMFNELFKKDNKSIEEKKSRSPYIERKKGNMSFLKDSIDNVFYNEENFNKYNTNTNVNIFFPRKNNNSKFNELKINMDFIRNNNYEDSNYDSDYTNTTHFIFNKPGLRANLSTDNKRYIISKNITKENIKLNNYRKSEINNNNIITDINLENEINNNKYDFDNNKEDDNIKDSIDNKVYNDNKIFKNQKYKISNSPDPYYNNKNDYSYNRMNNDVIQPPHFNKNLLLYSKPLLKKSTEINNLNNNINIIYLKQKEKNNNIIKKNKNNSYINNINSNKKLFNQKNIYNSKENSDKKKKINQFSEIVIKNVSTQDNKLHVFIKYVELGDIPKKYKKTLYNNLTYEHIDSINLSGKSLIKEKIFVYRNNKLNKKKSNNNLGKRRAYNILKESKILDIENNNKKKGIKNDKKNNTKDNKFLTNIGEEEENLITVNNSKSLGEEDHNINNAIIFLIDFLQNMYNDNKKLILFNFFKNLKKIKTSALLHSSIKNKEKNKLKFLNSTQRNYDKNLNGINNYNYINSNKKIKKDDNNLKNKTSNLKFDRTNSLNLKITRNKENKYNLNCFINPKKELPEINDDEDLFKNTYNLTVNNQDFINNQFYNTSFNKTNNNINTIINTNTNNSVNEEIYGKKSSLKGNIKKLREEVIKIKKKKENDKREEDQNEEKEEEKKNENENEKNNKVNKDIKDKDKDKEKLKQMKLAKLGKLFKKMEQENNIITAIKEQFLEWTNNNDFGLRKSENKLITNNKNDKKYDIKTFDMKNIFSKGFNEPKINENNNYLRDSNINEQINETLVNDFKKKIKNFKIKLIQFSLNNKILLNSSYEKKENKIKKIKEKKKYNNNRYNNFEYKKKKEYHDKEDSIDIDIEEENLKYKNNKKYKKNKKKEELFNEEEFYTEEYEEIE